MCGRFALRQTPEEVRRWFDYAETPNFPARYNIAPTQPIAIVRADSAGARHFALVRWGLIPSWVKDPADFSLLINARAETAIEKPSFRNPMRHGRCLVPASGFYEWRRPASGPKQAYWVQPRDHGLVAFAGLWETWFAPDGSDIETGAILTVDANAAIAQIHNRMPAVIAREDFGTWLDTANVPPKKAKELLKPAPEDLFEAIPVSNRVNAVANSGPELQERAEEVVETVKQKPVAKKTSAKPKAPPDDGQMSLL